METPKFYERAETVPIKARTVPVIDSSQVAPECLFAEDQISAFHVVGRKNGHSPAVPNASPVGLYTISEVHGRSYELVVEGMEEVGAWADEFGTLFSSHSIKGNNLEDPYIWPSPIMPEKFATQGLQDSSFIRRTVIASQVLRELGIEAEMTTRVIEPLTLPLGDQEMAIGEFKDEVLRRTLTRKGQARHLANAINPVDRKKFSQMRRFIDNADFRFSVRAMQTPERLSDLSKFETHEEAMAVLGRAFSFVNFSERLKSEQNPEYEGDFFDVNNPEDIIRYFGEYLPTKIGRYFATMHKNGITHGFPHPGNISTVGSIYDLDSVKGEKLGLGDQVNWENYRRDLEQLFFYEEGDLVDLGFLDLVGVDKVKAIELQKVSKNTMLRAYLESFGPQADGELTHALEIILKESLVDERYSDTTLKWIKQIVDIQGIDFPDIDDNYEQMLDAYEKYFSKETRLKFNNGMLELAVFATVVGSYFVEDRQYPNEFAKLLAIIRCMAPLLNQASHEKERIESINRRIQKNRRIKKATRGIVGLGKN